MSMLRDRRPIRVHCTQQRTATATLAEMVTISHLRVGVCKHVECVKLHLKLTLNGFLRYPRNFVAKGK